MTDVLYIKYGIRDRNCRYSQKLSAHIAIGISTKSTASATVNYQLWTVKVAAKAETWTTFLLGIPKNGAGLPYRANSLFLMPSCAQSCPQPLRNRPTNVACQAARYQVHFLRNIFATIPKIKSFGRPRCSRIFKLPFIPSCTWCTVT